MTLGSMQVNHEGFYKFHNIQEVKGYRIEIVSNNSNIKNLRDILTKIISEKYSRSNLENLPKTAAFFSEKDEVIDDSYKLRNKEFISIIPPIGGG